MTIDVRRAVAVDATALADFAARTFPLACPPSLPREHIAEFIADNLSADRFAGYLADPGARVYIVDGPDGPTGYALLFDGVHADGPQAWRDAPSSYLSKLYVDPGAHGGGVAQALLTAARADADGRGVWLNVNRDNQRAKRFYTKSGFALSGEKRFSVGATVFVDDVLCLGAGA